MLFRLADRSDFETVRALVSDCVSDLIDKGIDQWDSDYPPLEAIFRDIDEGSLFVLENDGNVIGTVCLDEKQEDEYSTVNWKLPTPAIVIHRLCVHPTESGRGYGTMIMELSERWAAERNFESIRLDTYSGNQTSLNLYVRLGFSRVGEVHFRGRKLPFICMEKPVASAGAG